MRNFFLTVWGFFDSLRRDTPPGVSLCLCRGIQHIFNENAVAGGGVIDQHVGHGANELAVLDNGRAGHECVKYRTKLFTILFEFVMNSV